MNRHGAAAFFLSAALSLAGAGTVMAAEGWAQEGNNWVYYNASGSRVYNAWRKGGDNLWRYLDSNGVMAVSSWVDDERYYVDASGIMAAGQWMDIPTPSRESGTGRYYFTGTGKAVKDKWEKIENKWYHFAEDGAMETGWLLDDMYYCDENGVMLTGWQQLKPPEEKEEDAHTSPYDDPDRTGTYWYYFSSSGKKALPEERSSGNIRQKRIEGNNYCLDTDGAMLTGWVCVTGDDSDSLEDYCFTDENGHVCTGWYAAQPPDMLDASYDNDVEWFYFSSKGIPKVGPPPGSATYKDLEKIGGNTYLFDEKGVPVYGIQKVFLDSDEGDYTAYYFGTRQQSSMLKGKFKIEENGELASYYFTSTGRGFTGVYDNCLYYKGRLQKADSADKYEVFTIDLGNATKNYVVNSSGRVAKDTTVKDANGVKLKTSSSGVLVREDDEEVDGNTYSTPEEPEWNADDY